jgi:Domain of unknown function (DUF6134)
MRAMLLIAALLAAPLAVANDAWNFRVLLDGREIGQHRYALTSAGDELKLRSEARFDVRVLFLSAYRYEHEAIEHWDGDCLRALSAQTDDNGRRESVSAAERDGRLLVQRAKGPDEYTGCVMSFAYWNPRILDARQLLNSQTGELLPVTVTDLGDEIVAVQGQQQLTQRHRIVAPGLQIDLWYAGERWVALEAPAAGGRRLRYELM